MRYSSAGHIAQFLITQNQITKLEKTGRMIAVTAKSEYTSREFELNPNSGLFLFTDGLTEEWN